MPFSTGLHLAHHVDSGVPFRNLPVLHQALVEDGYLPNDMVYPSYTALWRAMIRG